MEFKQIEVVLKDGTPCYLRSPGPNDGASVLRILKKVSGETNYLSRYPDEIKISLFQEKQFLEANLQLYTFCASVLHRPSESKQLNQGMSPGILDK